MSTVLENLTGMATMTDQVIAMDLLITAKSAVQNCARALTEATSPEVRTAIKEQLNDSILAHEQISQLMISKDWYHPFDISQQTKLVVRNADMALKLGK